MNFTANKGESIIDTEKRLQKEALYNQHRNIAESFNISKSSLDENEHKCGKSLPLIKSRIAFNRSLPPLVKVR